MAPLALYHCFLYSEGCPMRWCGHRAQRCSPTGVWLISPLGSGREYLSSSRWSRHYGNFLSRERNSLEKLILWDAEGCNAVMNWGRVASENMWEEKYLRLLRLQNKDFFFFAISLHFNDSNSSYKTVETWAKQEKLLVSQLWRPG